MCDILDGAAKGRSGAKTVPVEQAVGMVLAHDITEVRAEEFKGRAFKKGHVVTDADIEHLRRLGKEHLFVLTLAADELHEDDAAHAFAAALMGEGVRIAGEPKEGKITLIADRDGLLKINAAALEQFNLTGEAMCATLHNNTVVKRGRVVAGTRAIPLVVKRSLVEAACAAARAAKEKGGAVVSVKALQRPRVGVVITGNEVYYGRIKDAFAPIIKKKIAAYDGELIGVYYAPDDVAFIEARLRELLAAGADLLITSGGMSVDPDDVTRFAVNKLGVSLSSYGSPVLPGAMALIAYVDAGGGRSVPVLGVPACGMYHKTTVFDLLLPRVLAGERIGRAELAGLGHGGLCMDCPECSYPHCPFGK